MICKECPKGRNGDNSCTKLCEEIEKLLPKSQTGRLKGEFLVPPQMIDEINMDKTYGMRKHPIGIETSPDDVRDVKKHNTRR